jgi:hypothetical protein
MEKIGKVQLMNKALTLTIIISFAVPSFAEVNQQRLSQRSAQENVQSKRPADGIHTETIIAKAFIDKDKKKLAYTEKHTAIYKNGKLQTSTNDYFDLNGNKIAELNSDYTKSLMMPTYLFQDLRTGRKEGLRWDGGKYLIFRQEKEKSEKVKPLVNVENVFSCQGWHYYLIANLNQLKKRPIKMKLIFPSRLDYYSFRIRPLETTEDRLKLRLEFDSWIIRLFTPHLDITYDRNKRKIVAYYGPSNILDDKGEIQNVYIYYE